jgi:hypothetical protein
LLIADHTLKNMTGRQVAEKISQARPGLKVLHMSGVSRERLEDEAGIMPGADFLAASLNHTAEPASAEAQTVMLFSASMLNAFIDSPVRAACRSDVDIPARMNWF